MTLQNLNRILDEYEKLFSTANTEQFEVLKGLPFYNWPRQTNDLHKQDQDSDDQKFNHPGQEAATDFNHAIGLPRKNDLSCPLHDYEQLLYDTLQNNKHIWIKKATGLGVTEFMLRYMAWLCFNPTFANSQMCIVTGPRIELAITLRKQKRKA